MLRCSVCGGLINAYADTEGEVFCEVCTTNVCPCCGDLATILERGPIFSRISCKCGETLEVSFTTGILGLSDEAVATQTGVFKLLPVLNYRKIGRFDWRVGFRSRGRK